MNHPAKLTRPVADLSEEELADRLSALPPPPGLLSTEEEDEEADARARADIAAGRVYPHAIVREWLMTWGLPGRKPFKEWLALRDG